MSAVCVSCGQDFDRGRGRPSEFCSECRPLQRVWAKQRARRERDPLIGSTARKDAQLAGLHYVQERRAEAHELWLIRGDLHRAKIMKDQSSEEIPTFRGLARELDDDGYGTETWWRKQLGLHIHRGPFQRVSWQPDHLREPHVLIPWHDRWDRNLKHVGSKKNRFYLADSRPTYRGDAWAWPDADKFDGSGSPDEHYLPNGPAEPYPFDPGAGAPSQRPWLPKTTLPWDEPPARPNEELTTLTNAEIIAWIEQLEEALYAHLTASADEAQRIADRLPTSGRIRDAVDELIEASTRR